MEFVISGSGSALCLKSLLQTPNVKLFMRVEGHHRVQTSSLHCKKGVQVLTFNIAHMKSKELMYNSRA